MKKQLFMVAAALAVTTQTFSQTIINAGPVSGTWTASGSPYHIMGDIEVTIGEGLIIEPGVTVKFFNEVSFKIYGNLKAIGSQSSQIIFTLGATYCKGLQILNVEDTCKFVYCKFMNFKNKSEIEPGKIKGGAILAINSNIEIINSTFTNNQIQLDDPNYIIEGFGGAIYIQDCTGILKNSYLSSNGIKCISCIGFWMESLNGFGGAIYVTGQNFKIETNQFLNNNIELELSSIEAYCESYGGAIYSMGVVKFNTIQNNYCKSDASGGDYSGMSFGGGFADSYGGGIYGGAVINNIISNNSCISIGFGSGSMGSGGSGHACSKGGGIFGANLAENNTIHNNLCTSDANGQSYQGGASATAKSHGGGIYSSAQVINNLIYSNNCESEATAYSTYQYNSSASSLGGGLFGGNGINNTILNNQVHINAGITTEINGAGVYSGTLKNCIIYNNTGAPQISDAAVTYSCIHGGYSGQGNIVSDPMFINGPQGNYYLKQYPCQNQQSPCVDAGDPSTQIIYGTTRTDDYPDLGIVDMGFHYALTNPKVMADFNSDINCGTPPMVVNFFDNSYQYQMDSVEYEWDFENDGIIDSYDENPVWTYNENGLYSVKQKIMGYANDTIMVDSIIKENFIISSDEFLVLAGFTFNKSYGEQPLIVTFNDTSLITPCGEIEQWKWDFQNDGIIDSYEQNPLWTYSEPGIFSVKLIAGNSNYLAYDTIIKQGIITICHMSPGFYAEPLSGDVPLDVSFYDTSYIEYTQISTWKWDFQHDGVIDAYGPNPTWTYPEAGIYSVELRITDTSGQIWKSVVKEGYITVNPITGIPNQSMEVTEKKLEIYPNPFTNDLIIEFEFVKPDIATVQIFDVAFKHVASIAMNEKVEIGKKTWKWETQNNNISSGIYYITLTTSSEKQYIKKCIRVN